MIDPSILAAVFSQFLQPVAPAPRPKPIPKEFLIKHGASEPVTGKEIHVMYHVIVPTEAYANVRFIASQTVAVNQGEGLTLEDRKKILSLEAKGLRDLMLDESEKLRRDLSDKAFVTPVGKRTRSPRSLPAETK